MLRNPVMRAQYLLQLHGVDPIGETARAAVAPALLMEVMEGREALEDTSPANEPHVRDLLASTQARVHLLQAEFAQHYAAMQLQSAAESVVALQYMSKLATEALEWISDRADADRARAAVPGPG